MRRYEAKHFSLARSGILSGRRMRRRTVSLVVAIALVGQLLVNVVPSPAEAAGFPQSQNIAMVPNAFGRINHGGTLPTSGFPSYSPDFTDISPEAIRDDATNPIGSGFDTVVLNGMCDIATFLADAEFKSRIEGFIRGGGKLVIWDSECSSTDYSLFALPFTTSNPGNAGAQGTLTDEEDNTLSSTDPTSAEYVDVNAVAAQTDAVGDANVFTTFDPGWFIDLKGTNILGVNGPVQAYANLGDGLIIYSGLDKDFLPSGSFDPTSTSGSTHLARIWMLELLQPWNPDGLPHDNPVVGGKTSVLALGDSYSAGVGGLGEPQSQDCWARADASFSGQLVGRAKAAGRNVEYENHACIGATTADILNRSQPNTSQSKQLDYVTSMKPDVITLTIGGNDIGFGPIATGCVINSVVFAYQCSVNAKNVNLVDKAATERSSWDGLYDRLAKTYVALRNAQGSEGDLYVLTYPTVFEKTALWDPDYLFALRSGPFGLPTTGNCFGFSSGQSRESNQLSTRLGDTIYLAAQAANAQVGNVHFVDWRSEVVTESEGFFGRTKVRVAYNSEGLCARNRPWDMNGLAFGEGQRFGKDSFHPTEQGYKLASERLESELGW